MKNTYLESIDELVTAKTKAQRQRESHFRELHKLEMRCDFLVSQISTCELLHRPKACIQRLQIRLGEAETGRDVLRKQIEGASATKGLVARKSTGVHLDSSSDPRMTRGGGFVRTRH